MKNFRFNKKAIQVIMSDIEQLNNNKSYKENFCHINNNTYGTIQIKKYYWPMNSYVNIKSLNIHYIFKSWLKNKGIKEFLFTVTVVTVN